MKTPAQVKVHRSVKRAQWLVYALVITLVFEGLLRKLAPGPISIAIFFVKDVLCLYAFTLLIKVKFSGPLSWVSRKWGILSILLVPLLFYTAFFDLPLGVFAAKQYLLYTVVGLIVPVAFPPHQENSFKVFYTRFTWLIVPTTLVALLQNALSADHWLNRGIGNESLEAFSAGGYLRVSSTFSFTGQYSWFLNAVCAFLILSFVSPSIHSQHQKGWFRSLIALAIGILFMLGAFVTGGRSAVLGAGACIGLGFVLAGWRTPSLTFIRGIVAGLILYSSFVILSSLKPQYFAAYMTRSSGFDGQSHSAELIDRVTGSYLNWTTWFWRQDTQSIWLGNGMGVMSNGVDKISSYAHDIRSDGTWTETDISTTAWEGGIYLLIVWYVFRTAVIWFCFKRWSAIQNKKYATGAAFLLANIIIWGLMSTLAMQPPIAIWFWLSVGSLLAIYQFDRAANRIVIEQKGRIKTWVNFTYSSLPV